MSAPEWTPGPWLAGEGGGRGATTFAYETGTDGKQQSAIAGCTLEFVERPMKERIANARLIASAPEMYEALVEARIAVAADIEEAECGDDGRYASFLPVFVERLAKIDAALAKARGEAL